jgi:hypothetical protein
LSGRIAGLRVGSTFGYGIECGLVAMFTLSVLCFRY